MSKIPENEIRLLADQFVDWLTPYGRIDPERCPLVETDMRVMPSNFHSPTYWMFGLYRTYSITEDRRYKDAADRLFTFYFACMRNPRTEVQGMDFYLSEWLKFMEKTQEEIGEWRLWAHVVRSILAPPFMQGMALAAYRQFKHYNPGERAFDTKAGALYDWLQEYRWNESSRFRCCYGSWKHGVTDVGYADDLVHVGRGLVGYYDVSRRNDVLTDALGLAHYYLNEMELGTYRGCWSSKLGTWAAGPTEIDNFEHFVGIRACDIGFIVTGGAIVEYLTDLLEFVKDKPLREAAAPKCVSSMRWMFDQCQFDDGAIGIAGRDDGCTGSVAMAIMTYLRCRDAGFLSKAEEETYLKKAVLGRDWMLKQMTPEGIESGGYVKKTGGSSTKPLDNLAWFLGLTLEAMTKLDKLGT